MDKAINMIELPESQRGEAEAQRLRMSCLEEAIRIGGNGDLVVQNAQKFHDFVSGKTAA